MTKPFNLPKAYFAAIFNGPGDVVILKAPKFSSYQQAWDWIFSQGDKLPVQASAVEVYLK